MAYSNPFQPQNPLLPQQQPPRIDPVQFRQFAVTLNDNALAQLVQMARQRGISDADIQAGINFIRSL
jgi:hypothetical protein